MYVLVHPDILKIEKPYWYKVEKDIAHFNDIRKGLKVRVEIHGRKTKGWIIQIAEHLPEEVQNPDKIKSVSEIVGLGVPEHLLSVSMELAKRFYVSPVVFYRKFSPTKTLRLHAYRYDSHVPSNSDIEKMFLVDPRSDRRKIIAKLISETGSTIVITPQNHKKIAEFIKSLGHKVVVYESRPTKRNQSFEQCLEKNVVVIGSRSALFAPLTDCKSIIVLDDSYEQLKEERSPRFHVLDCARMYAELLGSDMYLITSVPSIYSHGLRIEDLRDNNQWPKVHIRDSRDNDPVEGDFTQEVIQAIRSSIQQGLHSVIVLNNISSSKLNVCAKCNTISSCPDCGRNLMLSAEDENKFECKFCGYHRPEICEQCGSTKFKRFKKGSKTVTDEVKRLFPKVSVCEVTSKTLDDEILKNSSDSNPTIFVGTTSIFYRDYLFGKVGNVVFFQFDSMLYQPRIDAFNACLVAINSALRCLRKTDNKFPLLISTKSAESQFLTEIENGDIVSNNNRDLRLREKLKLAPFWASVEIKLEKQAGERLIESVDPSYLVGKTIDNAGMSVMFKAKNHHQLSKMLYHPLRKIAANTKVAIYVDDYD